MDASNWGLITSLWSSWYPILGTLLLLLIIGFMLDILYVTTNHIKEAWLKWISK